MHQGHVGVYMQTTSAVTVNESEPRLVEDLRLWLSRLAPASDMYLHNDLDQRSVPGTPAELLASDLCQALACTS